VLAWGDTFVCRGHEIVAAANSATHGEFAISPDEYRAQIRRASEWFTANPSALTTSDRTEETKP
jgi:hypothetical protein